MKKRIILSLCSLLALSMVVAILSHRKSTSNLLYANVEALADTEYRVGTGVICAYDRNCWCIYYDPYEEYEACPVSDVWVGPWS